MGIARYLSLTSLSFASVVTSGLIRPVDYATDADLFAFVSRPDLRPPKFNIDVQDAKHLTNGYWFVAPYDDLRNRAAASLFTPGQVGPHIYDGFGNLVWSGAHLFSNRPTFDFKTATCNQSPCLTFILNHNPFYAESPQGSGVVLDNTFTIRDILPQDAGNGVINMHEFTISPAGTATTITFRPRRFDVTSSYPPRDQKSLDGWVGDNGFREIDIATGVQIFEWWALDHVHPSESLVARPQMPGALSSPWDFFHLNSVDKNSDGDYLISSRYLNAIFKVSGRDGSIIWQLGGRRSTFTFGPSFKFSSQHDARFRQDNATHTILSFLNNAADNSIATSSVSSAFTVLLDHSAKTAQLLDSNDRPDRELTHLRGNVQHLENGHKFVCWSENGRISEFDSNGQLLLDAHFASHRFVTYRAYKLNFTGAPAEPPALKSLVYGAAENPGELDVTAMYVSWNGATEVHSWRFYRASGADQHPVKLGEVRKKGFETAFMVSGVICSVFAEAVAADGKTVLGTSVVERSVLPAAWDTTVACEAVENFSDGHLHPAPLGFPLNIVALPLGAYLACVMVVLFCIAAYKARSRLLLWRREDMECRYTPLLGEAVPTLGRFKALPHFNTSQSPVS